MFKEKFKKSIRFKFLATMSIILFIGTFVLSIVIATNQGRIFRNSLIHHGESLASFIAKLSKDPLLMKDSIQLDTIVNDANKDEDIVYAIIYDEQGNLLTSQYASINYRSQRIKVILLGLSRDNELQDIINAIKEKEPIIELSAPVMIDIKPIGKVTLGMSGYGIKQQILKTIMFVIALNLVVVFVLGVILFIASRKILLDPISELARATSTLADGDLSTQVKVKTTGEIQTLVDSFNKMAKDLKKTMVSKEALEDSEKKYRALVDNALVGVYRTNLKGNFLYANDALARIFEAESPEKLISTNALLRYKDPKDREVLIENLKSKNKIDHFELEMVTMSGKPINVLISAILEKDIISGMVMDITEHKKLEAKLIHAQKMETVGTLAGGVAHDFNNILTAIIGYGNLLKMKMKDDDPLLHFAEQILSSSERAANLVRSLLAFSRKQITNPRPLNINALVNRVEKLLLRIIGEDIQLKTALTDKDLTVVADSGQIEQVIINLATNARDAMPNGGTLTISTELTKPDKEFITANNPEKTWGYALISVSDTGIGMDKDTKDKIFEPFFTTKEVGKGTGLGLSIVYGIVQQHDGFIDCYSGLGKGTTFKIYLPIIKLKDTVQTKSAEITELKGGTETILVAEDEEEVRMIAKTVLEESGYQVIEALDGEDAINKFIENKDRVRFLLFDIIMPKVSGRAAFEKIKAIRPDIKVLFVSGYSADFIHKQEILEQGLNFMSKPITPTALLRRVREVLDN